MSNSKPAVLGVAVLAAALVILLATGVIDLGAGVPPDAVPTDGDPEAALTADGSDPDGAAALRGSETVKATAPAPTLSGPHMTGRVIDETGAPIAGATVVSFADDLQGTITPEALAEEGFRGGSTTSDAEGRFAVAVATDAPFHYVIADAKGFSPGLETSKPAGSELVLTLKPAIALVGSVRNMTKQPVAGAGVTAWILVDGYQIKREVKTDADGRYRIDDLPADLAPTPGRWRGYSMPSWIEVRATSYAPLLVENIVPQGDGPERTFDLTLNEGARLSGTIREAETNRPIAGARVVLHSLEGLHGYGRTSGGGFSNPFAPRIVFETMSDEAGGYVFENMPSRGPHPSASHNGHASGGLALGGVLAWKDGYTVAGESLALVKAGSEVEASITLWPAATIKGRVLDADGTPIKKAYVGVTVGKRLLNGGMPKELKGMPLSGMYTEADGTFLITGAPAKREGATEGELAIWAGAVERAGFGRYKQHKQPVTFEYGKVNDIGDLTLDTPEATHETTVVVLAPDGSPYYGAQVSRGQWGMRGPSRTDRDGRLSWTWATPRPKYPWTEIKVMVQAPGYAPTPATLLPPGEGDTDEVTVTLMEGSTVAGQVLLADGSPARNASVNIGDGNLTVAQVWPPRRGMMVPNQGLSERGLPASYTTVQTDEDGRFSAQDLPPGPYHLRATMARRVPIRGTPGGMVIEATISDIPSNATSVELRLPLDDSPEVGTLKGRVVSAETGEAVPGLQLSVTKDGKSIAYAFSSARSFGTGIRGTLTPTGEFTMPNIPVGECTITAKAQGYAALVVDAVQVTAGQTTAVPTMRIGRGIVVSGTLTSDVSLKGRRLSFANAEASAYVQADIGADGRYSAGGFAPGTYQIRVYPQGREKALATPMVPEGAQTLVIKEGAEAITLDLRLLAAGTISLQPRDKRLPPAPWSSEASTIEQSKFGKQTRVTLTASDGTVLLNRVGVSRNGGVWGNQFVLPGRYVARLELPGEEPKDQTVDVEAGGQVTVTWQ